MVDCVSKCLLVFVGFCVNVSARIIKHQKHTLTAWGEVLIESAALVNGLTFMFLNQLSFDDCSYVPNQICPQMYPNRSTESNA